MHRSACRGGAPIGDPATERDLARQCREVARRMGALLLEVGQRRARGSGTTVGFPDLVLVCAGQVRLVELKRPAAPGRPGGRLSPAQLELIERCAAQGVTVHVVDAVEEFAQVVNGCRRRRRP